MTPEIFKTKISRLLFNGEPFFFIVDFEKTTMQVHTFTEALQQGILFAIKGTTNLPHTTAQKESASVAPLVVDPYPFHEYLENFEEVVRHLKAGNSFLTNLTFPSKITAPMIDLNTVYKAAHAPYKLLYRDKFVCFSPECFVKIENDHIYSYPMKGTIDANLNHAAALLLSDPKEQQEHNTIVDLIRNDLSMVAKEVTVTKFRYLEKIATANGELLQTSSEIRGKLPADWRSHFGELLLSMLPAGSISGAPKQKTGEIIKKAERYKRGFYTGIFCIFDGKTIDSAVAIRFIERQNDGTFWYKSGGGITHRSTVKEEYIELLKKIYIPTV